MNKLTHVAVIADGNGRWAERRGLERSAGHEQGLNKVEDMMHWCVDIGIPVLSVYCFSWENWSRPKEEVDALFDMANQYFERYREFAENNIRVVISGTRERVPPESVEKMERIQRETAHCDGLTLNLCCNYSGRMEIVDAIAKGAPVMQLFDIPARESIGRAKSVPADEYQAVYETIRQEMAAQIDAVAAQGGDQA